MGSDATGGRDPRQVAHEICWEADLPDPADRAAEARRALAIWPDCADAYVILGQDAATTPEEALQYFRLGVQAGERALGPRPFRHEVGNFWGILETRPYMRARYGLATTHWELGAADEAIAHARDMLRLCPGDNMGVRYLLCAWLLARGREHELRELLGQYEEASADWAYTNALLIFRQQGDVLPAWGAARKAVAHNPHVPPLLLDARRIPRRLPEDRGWGDWGEAVHYAAANIRAWRSTPGARKWLRRVVATLDAA